MSQDALAEMNGQSLKANALAAMLRALQSRKRQAHKFSPLRKTSTLLSLICHLENHPNCPFGIPRMIFPEFPESAFFTLPQKESHKGLLRKIE